MIAVKNTNSMTHKIENFCKKNFSFNNKNLCYNIECRNFIMRIKISSKLLLSLSTIFSILCLLTAIVMIIFYTSAQKPKKKTFREINSFQRVLLLRSYHPSYFTYETQDRGLEKGNCSDEIEYDIFYMDTKTYNSDEDLLIFHDFLKSRIEKRKKYDAVLLTDDQALKFGLKYQDELFKDIPMVFFGINSLSLAEQAAANPMITGFFENHYLSKLIDIAIKLFPKKKTIVAIHDNSEAGKTDWDAFSRLTMSNPAYTFINLDSTKYSQEEFIEELKNIPEDSIIFYMTGYSDKYGNVYTMKSRTDLILKYSKAPIFRNYVGGEGYGVLGSYYMDFENQSRRAADLLADVLHGKDISTIPLDYETPGLCVFDWQLMNKYKLDFSTLPKETVFVNYPYESILQNKLLFSAIFVVVIGLLILSITSYIYSLHTRKMNKELLISRNSLKKAEEEMIYQIQYDEVLDILNRKTITQRIHDEAEDKSDYTILIIDIDGFKALNENYGHSFADSVLQYLVALLKDMTVNRKCLLGRYGGDEFILYLKDLRLTADHPSIIKLLDAIRAPIPLGDETLAITASIGIAQSDDISSPEQLISNAETAMYEAKNHGRNGATLYDDEMKANDREEKLIKEKLEAAFNNDGFFMVYQPKVDSKTKEVNGYEALIRMKEPGMYPGKFIPVAERNGWIWKIGRITTELVIRQMAEWRKAGKRMHPVSINYSSNQLNDHGYIDFLADLLKEYGVPSDLIEIEITEGLFLEKSALADDIFKRFKSMGIRLLMDDFGTGYSSLGYLTYIPVDVIKLDKSLVDTYLVDGKDSFIRNIIHLMHDLNKEMIIEGVEEEWQFNRLKEFGADTIQGYYFSKPLPAEEAIDFKIE